MRGDAEAYADLVRPYQEVAFRVAFLVTRSAADAEDASQDALLKAFTHIHRYDSKRPFRPWLLQIVGNEARNRRRSIVRRTHHELRIASQEESTISDPGDQIAQLDAYRKLLAVVEELPPRERLVIGLRYFLELSEEETAAAAGIPRGTVKSRTARAMGRLRKLLENEDV